MWHFSMYGKMLESGLTEIIPLVCISAIWGQYAVFLHPGSHQSAQCVCVWGGCE